MHTVDFDRAQECGENSIMWFNRPQRRPDWSAAERHLRQADRIFPPIIDRVGPCTLVLRRDYFVVLCKAIFTQQISTAVATVLFGRFRDLFPRRRPTPARVLQLLKTRPEAARGCGLSRQKASYLIDLSTHFIEGRIPTRHLSRYSDEEVIAALDSVKGIGRWTAEMFLIFTLNRSDVLPVDDLGLQKAMQKQFGMRSMPSAKRMIQLAEPWRPYRSIATWYLWRSL